MREAFPTPNARMTWVSKTLLPNSTLLHITNGAAFCMAVADDVSCAENDCTQMMAPQLIQFMIPAGGGLAEDQQELPTGCDQSGGER